MKHSYSDEILHTSMREVEESLSHADVITSDHFESSYNQLKRGINNYNKAHENYQRSFHGKSRNFSSSKTVELRRIMTNAADAVLHYLQGYETNLEKLTMLQRLSLSRVTIGNNKRAEIRDSIATRAKVKVEV